MEEKTKLAHALASGACGGSYAEGAIILCTSISTMSSLMWIEKKHEDKRRFIELVTRFPQEKFDPTMVSVPLLSQGHNSWEQKLGVSDLAICYTSDVDKTEKDVINLCSAQASLVDRRKCVRRYSYAFLLYKHVRCGFIHTYSTTGFAASDDPLKYMSGLENSKITYVNYLASEGLRKIYFPLEWISEVARNIAAGLDGECNRLKKDWGQNLNVAAPNTWWIDGA
jgi:hypothetical protein